MSKISVSGIHLSSNSNKIAPLEPNKDARLLSTVKESTSESKSEARERKPSALSSTASLASTVIRIDSKKEFRTITKSMDLQSIFSLIRAKSNNLMATSLVNLFNFAVYLAFVIKR